MNAKLSKRHTTALDRLRAACSYEDHNKGGTGNFILASALAPGVGQQTLAELVQWGLIIEGPNRWRDETGYRITEDGQAALRLKPKPKAKSTARPLRRLEDRPTARHLDDLPPR